MGFQETLDQIINQADSQVSKEFAIMGANLFRGILEEYQKNKYVIFYLFLNIFISFFIVLDFCC
jgi:hypothetical protein